MYLLKLTPMFYNNVYEGSLGTIRELVAFKVAENVMNFIQTPKCLNA